MPSIDVVRRVSIARTPRVVQLEGLFDLPKAKQSEQRWKTELPLDAKPWSVGLIVGPSGAGKSSVARAAFGNQLVQGFEWPSDKSLVDAFPAELSIKDITGLLSSVGFSSPPAWLRPFGVLSTGEQFRVTLARALAESTGLVVMDEFTSVVDRTVAQIGSAAVAKAVRRSGRQFVAVTCHYDVEDWLQPDWVYQPHLNRFHWRELQRRPSVDLTIRRCTPDTWVYFAPHHYLSRDLNRSARCFLACADDRPVAFVAVLPTMGFRGQWREHRIVCLPEFQGIGVGMRLSETIGGVVRAIGGSYSSVTSHPGFIAARRRSPAWVMTQRPSMRAKHSVGTITANWRWCATFRYVGQAASEREARGLWAKA